ncbi:pilus assembly protein [Nitrosopumilus oxyclinae]|uniref:Pilus assembly protein n=1 Tax=Nitrosopumilus oxyclinae TaxID=1959104 RepID=A0A7D5M3B9_9ARCH|nr:pirin family protein [Nitrosopumilus oxyclinae]QLH05115.1 pilus assembly protein [Nitrosopumilus oxyclinae]
MTLQVLHRDDLKLGGFAGIREHRLVVDPRVFGNNDTKAWSGIGNFVYLADAKFIPNGETHLHPHKEIDVISVIVDGRISHKGSLEEGSIIEANQVQVQRAGGEGFLHNEVNPDDKENRMIQLWITPEKSGEPAGYKSYSLQQGKIIRVYGGDENQDDTFASKTILDVGLVDAKQTVSIDGEFIAYVTLGKGTLNGQKVTNGDLVRGNELEFHAETNSQIIIVRKI